MNIHSVSTDAASRAYVHNADAARGNSATRGKEDEKRSDNKSSRVDSVVLSNNARSVAAAVDAVKSAPDVRAEKVDAIKQRVTDGTYHVDARVLARKMLKDAE